MVSNHEIGKILDEESLDIIRETISSIKQSNNLGWKQVAFAVDSQLGLVNVLTNFVIKKKAPRIIHLRLFLDFIERHLSDSPDAPQLSSYRNLKEALFGNSDKYMPFKEMLEMSSSEQESLSAKASGTYIAIRRNGSSEFVVSHVLIANTYTSIGLPTCRIMRRRQDGNGEITIDSSVWKKNQHIYLVGYEKPSGHIRTIQMTPIETNFQFNIGITSGHESNGSAFSARVHVIRTTKNISYRNCRELTGIFSNLEDLQSSGIVECDLQESIKKLSESTYTCIDME